MAEKFVCQCNKKDYESDQALRNHEKTSKRHLQWKRDREFEDIEKELYCLRTINMNLHQRIKTLNNDFNKVILENRELKKKIMNLSKHIQEEFEEEIDEMTF